MVDPCVQAGRHLPGCIFNTDPVYPHDYPAPMYPPGLGRRVQHNIEVQEDRGWSRRYKHQPHMHVDLSKRAVIAAAPFIVRALNRLQRWLTRG